MKPRNFPARVNARRKRALQRLLASIELYSLGPTFSQNMEVMALQARIEPLARGVKTKVNRAR